MPLAPQPGGADLDEQFVTRVGQLAVRLYHGGGPERDAAAVLHSYLRARERGPGRLMELLRAVGQWMTAIRPNVEGLPDDYQPLRFTDAVASGELLDLAAEAADSVTGLDVRPPSAEGFPLKALVGVCAAIHCAELLGMTGEFAATIRKFERKDLQ